MSQAGKSLISWRKKREAAVQMLTAPFVTMPEVGYSRTMTYLRRAMYLVLLLFVLLLPVGLILLVLICWLFSKKDKGRGA
jgi:hypothetical protein